VFPDVTLFNLETQAARDKDKSRNLTLNIATVREVSSAVSYRPTEAKWRIAIVDDVETMQETAQEAFLKTLEEPPPYAVVVLVTSDADVLLPTIRSRCVTVRFGLSPVGQIHAALLASGAGAELADRAATAAQGAMGWAFQAIDDQSLIEQRESTSKEAMELVLASSYERMVKAVLVADSFGKQRDDVFALLRAVQGVWRSALYLQQGFESDSTALLRGDAGERLGAVSLTDLMRALRSVDVCIANLEANVRPRLAMESMVLAWPKVRER
jgi:DNA polymerase-3 subunit delta'